MDTLAPIGLSTYKRISHLKKTIEALKKNKLAEESELYIFSDAPKPGDESEVKAVRDYIRTICGFKKVYVIERKKNNIVFNNRDGMRLLLNNFGKMIWLEEDVITAPGFLTFLNEALEYYKNNKRIISISAYTFPLNCLEKYDKDVFFIKRFNAWGFATWSDRFDPFGFDLDRKLAKKFLENSKLMEKFRKELGPDIKYKLMSIYNNEVDALDLKIMFYQFIHGLFTVYPKKSLVENIGHDGTGVHCGKTSIFHHYELWNKTDNFIFMKKIKINKVIVKSNYNFRYQEIKGKGLENEVTLNYKSKLLHLIKNITANIINKTKCKCILR